MKIPYQKPLIAVERYSLTQAISSCTNIKINSVDSKCVLDDPHSTNSMRNLAHRFGFLEPCTLDLSGHMYDGVCYHTNVNAAFTS